MWMIRVFLLDDHEVVRRLRGAGAVVVAAWLSDRLEWPGATRKVTMPRAARLLLALLIVFPALALALPQWLS